MAQRLKRVFMMGGVISIMLALHACEGRTNGGTAVVGDNDAPGAPGVTGVPGATEPETLRVTINGHRFRFELALDEESRVKGLGGRDRIPADEGMLFVFPRPQLLAFVMRDCPVPIDVAYLDGAGRVVAIHEMQPEAPRAPDEAGWEYEQRLKRYPSRFPAQFAVETAGGRMSEIGLRVGQRVEIDTEALKRRAR